MLSAHAPSIQRAISFMMILAWWVYGSSARADFGPPSNYDVGAYALSVAAGDFNNDGILDLAVTSFGFGENRVSVLLRNVDGTFETPVRYLVGESPRSVALCDLNADGVMDIVTANSGDNTVTVLLGNGDGTFQAARNFVTGDGPQWVAVGDFNGDG